MKIFGVVGWKNTGKTGLMERLVAEFVARNYTVSTLKHAHHRFDVDQPGKDSYRHRVAGASEVLLASSNRIAIMQELRGAPEPPLQDLIARISPVDILLIEGFKGADHPKVETRRAVVAAPPIAPTDTSVRAIASDTPVDGAGRPVFDLNDTRGIADLIEMELAL